MLRTATPLLVPPARESSRGWKGKMRGRKKKRKKRKPVLYMDTSSWNALWDLVASGRVRRHILKPFRVMFSSNVLDEVAATPEPARRTDILGLTLDVCYPTPFNHHIEVMIAELLCWRSAKRPAFKDYLLTDPDFQMSWRAFSGLPELTEPVRLAVSQLMNSVKKEALGDLRQMRDVFPNCFKQSARQAPHLMRATLDAHLRDATFFREWAYRNLVQIYGLPITRSQLDELDPRRCPALRVGVSYFACLSYVAATGIVKPHKINQGDLKDCQHAVYAGISDFFTTEEEKMRKILGELIPDVRTKVLSLKELLAAKCGWRAQPGTGSPNLAQ